jgi:hypothetical protein
MPKGNADFGALVLGLAGTRPAVPFLLGINSGHNGRSLSVP